MSELKCPACKATLSEPLQTRCPVCNLEGINRMFLTLEDYEEWKKNVLDEHIKKLRSHRVFAGSGGVLVLLDDGRLFGFGDNTQGQYCPNYIGKLIDKPEKIADNVISAATGYNYSLYLDDAGKVHFLGNSGIPYKERFNQGNLIFKEVYANNERDVFWAVDKNYTIYTWGEIDKEKIKPLKVFEPIETELKKITSYSAGVGFETGGTGEIINILIPDYMFISYGFEYSISSIKSTLDYKQLVKKYGECNLKIGYEFASYEYRERLKEKLQNRFLGKKPKEVESPGYFEEKVLIKPVIYFLDRYIFKPIEENINECAIKEIYIDNLRNNYFDSLNVDNRNGKSWPEKYQEIFRKIDLNKTFSDFSLINETFFHAFLEKKGTLHFYLVSWKSDYYKKIGQINDISDASGHYASEFYFIDRNKKLWRFSIPMSEVIFEVTKYDKKEYNINERILLVHEF